MPRGTPSEPRASLKSQSASLYPPTSAPRGPGGVCSLWSLKPCHRKLEPVKSGSTARPPKTSNSHPPEHGTAKGRSQDKPLPSELHQTTLDELAPIGKHGHSAWPPAGQLEIRKNRQRSIENHLLPRTLGSYPIFSFSETSLSYSFVLLQQRDRSRTNMCAIACEHCCPEVWPRSQRRTSAVAWSHSDLLPMCCTLCREPARLRPELRPLQATCNELDSTARHEDKLHHSSCPHHPWPRNSIYSGVVVQGDGQITLHSSSIYSNDDLHRQLLCQSNLLYANPARRAPKIDLGMRARSGPIDYCTAAMARRSSNWQLGFWCSRTGFLLDSQTVKTLACRCLPASSGRRIQTLNKHWVARPSPKPCEFTTAERNALQTGRGKTRASLSGRQTHCSDVPTRRTFVCRESCQDS